jgi:large subunit ribosomal protein L9
MKVILLQDVAKIGKRSDLVDVPDGYALNQLIPKKMAEPATNANKKRIERMQASQAASQEADQAKFESAGAALAEAKVQVAAQANEQGHLFKAVSEADVAAGAKEAGIDIDPSLVVVGSPIKELGEHTVSLERGDSKVEFTIEVIKK